MDQERFDIPFEGNRIMADARIDGSMESEEDICVEGVICGSVCGAKRVVINKAGVIEGEVNCSELYVNGRITGNVCAIRRAVLGASALIEGGLITACLEITPGARIEKGLKLKNTSK